MKTLYVVPACFYHATFHHPERYNKARLTKFKFGVLHHFIHYHFLFSPVVCKLLFRAAMLIGCLLWEGWEPVTWLLFSALHCAFDPHFTSHTLQTLLPGYIPLHFRFHTSLCDLVSFKMLN